jgi:5'-nucleotidase
MKKREDTQILLTNDDGIQSPGLWAAAYALSALGYITVAAPRDQASATGRSLPITSDGHITRTTLHIGEDEWPVFAVGGTPAQVVLHSVLEIMERKPDLVVSGINYGENLGTSITISGTVGAAMEGAALGIPAIAVSLQLLNADWLSHSTEVDFSTAAFFTHYFAKRMLEGRLLEDVDLLKIDVPAAATPDTPWKLSRLARHRIFTPFVERKGSWDEIGIVGGEINLKPEDVEPDSDAYTLYFDKQVAVVPISLDMTSRVDFDALCSRFRCDEP